MVDGFVANISERYDDFEIILANQVDDGPFLRGQLCNLGFLESVGSLIIFEDIDIRFFDRIDFVAFMKRINHPFVPFDCTVDVEILPDGSFKRGNKRERLSGFGACAVFTREQFEKSNGFSNLPIGWGAEDNIMNTRVRYQRIPGSIGHISHQSNSVLWSDEHRRNYDLWQSELSRDSNLDSFRQTVYKKRERRQLRNFENASIVSFYGIGVPEDFAYKNLLPCEKE
jgi:hypothetical protein